MSVVREVAVVVLLGVAAIVTALSAAGVLVMRAPLGVATLLRRQRDEHQERPGDEEDRLERRRTPRVSEAVRTLAVALVAFDVTFGGYVVTHGTVTPGGGFQGGVVLATAPLVIYLATGPRTFTRIAPEGARAAHEGAR